MSEFSSSPEASKIVESMINDLHTRVSALGANTLLSAEMKDRLDALKQSDRNAYNTMLEIFSLVENRNGNLERSNAQNNIDICDVYKKFGEIKENENVKPIGMAIFMNNKDEMAKVIEEFKRSNEANVNRLKALAPTQTERLLNLFEMMSKKKN